MFSALLHSSRVRERSPHTIALALQRDLPLSTALCDAAAQPLVGEEVLEDTLVAQLAVAAARYPGLREQPETLVAYVGARLDETKSLLEGLAEVEFADLVLACAAASGDPRAVTLFEEHAMRGVDASLKRRGIADDIIEEAKQNVRERMLVRRADHDPRIVDYNGRGPLRHWLRVAVVREGILLSKREGKQEGVAFDFLSLPTAHDDPEIAFFKRRYRDEYKQAFEAATQKLSSRERALLRQQYLLGMNVDEIGTVYQVHRATAARWVQSAREELFAKARFELSQRLGVARTEIEDIVRMIESQLEVSLTRLLSSRSHQAEPPPRKA